MLLSKRCVFALLLAFFGQWLVVPVQAEGRRDFLLGLVTQCLEPKSDNYCSSCKVPRSDSECSGHDVCTKSLEIWRQSDEYTAFRDIKMCSCPSTFVHGLVLPRKPITGVEDPNRPDGIWRFAWEVGSQKIEASQMALVVNPRFHRDQDQLHVHMVRLKADVRGELSGTSITDLATVWPTAQHMADDKGLKDYGVLVTQNQNGSYLVVIDEESPEHKFTQAKCQ